MSVSPDAAEFIVAEWLAALADAGVDDADHHLIVCAGAPSPGRVKAVSFDPGKELTGDPGEGGIVVGPDKLAEANTPENLFRYRVAVFSSFDPKDPVEVAFLAGLLRHEIEHCKQRAAGTQAFELYNLVDEAIGVLCGDDAECGRVLFHSQPIEADADAAASAYLRARCGDQVSALLGGDDRFLVAPAEPPGPTEHLVERTVVFLHRFADVLNDPAVLPPDTTFADSLDADLPGSGDLWRALDSRQ